MRWRPLVSELDDNSSGRLLALNVGRGGGGDQTHAHSVQGIGCGRKLRISGRRVGTIGGGGSIGGRRGKEERGRDDGLSLELSQLTLTLFRIERAIKHCVHQYLPAPFPISFSRPPNSSSPRRLSLGSLLFGDSYTLSLLR